VLTVDLPKQAINEQPRRILVDGFVAATWKTAQDTFAIRPLRTLTKPEHAEIEREGDRLLGFLAPGRAGEVVIEPWRG